MIDAPWVVTVVHGRHEHLREQVRHLRALHPGVQQVVVAMGDDRIRAVLGADHREQVLDIDVTAAGLPLAAARNAGCAAAIDQGADLLVLLDVDCLLAPDAITAYRAAAERHPEALLAGPVSYLPPEVRQPAPDELASLRDPHPARPAPVEGEFVRHGNHDLFWSLNAALRPSVWERIGGFCTDYQGYGGEDTDFGWTAAQRGVELVWVGGADAYHLHHPVSRPPVEHAADIVRNASIGFRRWGRWPMRGWLDELTQLGLIDWVDGLPVARQAPR